MALYLGNSEKLKITSNNVKYCLILFSDEYITSGMKLLSSDNYTLTDSEGLYLTTIKEGE